MFIPDESLFAENRRYAENFSEAIEKLTTEYLEIAPDQPFPLLDGPVAASELNWLIDAVLGAHRTRFYDLESLSRYTRTGSEIASADRVNTPTVEHSGRTSRAFQELDTEGADSVSQCLLRTRCRHALHADRSKRAVLIDTR